MAFLTIDSIDVDVQTSSQGEGNELIGDKARMFDGSLRSTYITNKRKWTFLTGPLSETDANTIRAKSGYFILASGDFIPDVFINALLTVNDVQYVDNKGIDFYRYLNLLIEEQ